MITGLLITWAAVATGVAVLLGDAIRRRERQIPGRERPVERPADHRGTPTKATQ